MVDVDREEGKSCLTNPRLKEGSYKEYVDNELQTSFFELKNL